MSCSRCAGCMVQDFLLDMEDSSGPMWLQAWRCMNCGDIYESVLEQNRRTQEAKILASNTPVQEINGKVLGDSANTADLAA